MCYSILTQGQSSTVYKRKNIMNAFNISYAKTITTADRLNHHLCDCSKVEVQAIKEAFADCKKKTKMFNSATKGWG